MNGYLMNTYARLPVKFERGEGVWLWDTEGNRYLDALAGVAVCNLGHAHPAIHKALCDQAETLVHTSNIYQIETQERLGEGLCRESGMDKVFFSNSGAEANEAAIKIARLYGHNKKINNPQIIVMENSFHGRTMATLSATGNRKVQAGFEPLVSGFIRAPYNDLEAIRQIAENNQEIVAILVEPVQGEGGVRPAHEGYLAGLRELCDQHGWLLMLDEIQTGMGRTGKLFAHQHDGITPDVMTLAKGLGNGFPVGACLAHGAAADVLAPGTHGSTFGGNPLACRVGLTVLETMLETGISDKAAQMGQYLLEQFAAKLEGIEGVKDIRGKGLMIGIELDRDCPELVAQALEQKLLINVTAGNTIRLLPPLTLEPTEADQIVTIVSDLVRNLYS
ncbi:MAG: aspartate aminotransferase family protein [Gammaproteobacteria bacterium]|nr:aspartate aminotransferase family protein [Gammaproteobacteria bacterium]